MNPQYDAGRPRVNSRCQPAVDRGRTDTTGTEVVTIAAESNGKERGPLHTDKPRPETRKLAELGRHGHDLAEALQAAALQPVSQAVETLAATELRVFPVGPNKAPRTRHGWKDAGRHSGAVKLFRDAKPDSLAAIVVGATSKLYGVVVIDLDRHVDYATGEIKADGLAGWDGFIKSIGLDPLRFSAEALPCTTFTVKTPSGGRHAYFIVPPSFRLGTAVMHPAPGVDVKAEDGYVLAPNTAAGYEVLSPPNVSVAVLDTTIAGALALDRWHGNTARPLAPVVSIDKARAKYVAATTDAKARELAATPPGRRHEAALRFGNRLGAVAAINGENPERIVAEAYDRAVGGHGWDPDHRRTAIDGARKGESYASTTTAGEPTKAIARIRTPYVSPSSMSPDVSAAVTACRSLAREQRKGTRRAILDALAAEAERQNTTTPIASIDYLATRAGVSARTLRIAREDLEAFGIKRLDGAAKGSATPAQWNLALTADLGGCAAQENHLPRSAEHANPDWSSDVWAHGALGKIGPEVVAVLSNATGPLSVRQIADTAGRAWSTAARILQRLAEVGAVEESAAGWRLVSFAVAVEGAEVARNTGRAGTLARRIGRLLFAQAAGREARVRWATEVAPDRYSTTPVGDPESSTAPTPQSKPRENAA